MSEFRRHAAAVVITLGAGIGAAAAVVTLVERALLRPLPYAEPDRLVRVESMEPLRGSTSDNTARDLFDLAASATRLRDVTAYLVSDYNLSAGDRAVPVTVTFASSRLWPLAGIAPALGAPFDARHDRPGGDVRKVVLSDAMWRRHFGGAADIVGRSIVLGTASYEVLGVMPPGFAFPERSEAWVPLEAWFAYLGTSSAMVTRGARSYGGAARLAAGTGLETAQREADAIAARLAAEHPATNRGVELRLAPFAERLSAGSRSYLLLGLAAAAGLLAASLGAAAVVFAARRHARRQAVALHVALGATRAHLLRRAVGEGLPIGAAAGAGALAAGTGLTILLVRLVPDPQPLWLAPQLTPTVACGTVAAAMAAAVAGSIAASGGAGRLHDALRGRSAVPTLRARRALTTIQITLAVTLLVVALHAARDLRRLLAVHPGFDPAGVVSVYISPPGDDVTARERGASYAALYDRVIEELRQQAGVRAAAGINVLPLHSRQGWQRSTVTAAGQDAEAQAFNPVVNVLRASPGYFATLGIPLLEGRDLQPSDGAGRARVAVISARLAQRLWPGSTAVGRQFKLGAPGSPSPWTTVVGVAGNVRSTGLDREDAADVYFSYAQMIAGELHFVMKSDLPAGDAMSLIASVVARVNPHAAIFRSRPLDAVVAGSVWQPRLWSTALGIFAAMGGAVAAISLFAVVAALGAARARELAIRAAIGATALDLARTTGREGSRVILAGIWMGTAAGCLALGAARTQVPGLTGPTVWGAGIAMTAAAMLFAAAVAVPLLRAARTDPAAALRAD